VNVAVLACFLAVGEQKEGGAAKLSSFSAIALMLCGAYEVVLQTYTLSAKDRTMSDQNEGKPSENKEHGGAITLPPRPPRPGIAQLGPLQILFHACFVSKGADSLTIYMTYPTNADGREEPRLKPAPKIKDISEIKETLILSLLYLINGSMCSQHVGISIFDGSAARSCPRSV
jgi:hypothetical protein